MGQSPRDNIKSLGRCSASIFVCTSVCGYRVGRYQNFGLSHAGKMRVVRIGWIPGLWLHYDWRLSGSHSRVKIALLGKNPGLERTALSMHFSLVFSAPLGLLHPRPTAASGSGSCSGTVSPRAARRIPLVAEILLPPGTTVTATQQNLEYPKREGKGQELAVFYLVTKYLLQ